MVVALSDRGVTKHRHQTSTFGVPESILARLAEELAPTEDRVSILLHKFPDVDAVACALAAQLLLPHAEIYQGDGKFDGIQMRLPKTSQGLMMHPITSLSQQGRIFLFDASNTNQRNVGALGILPDIVLDTHEGDLEPNGTKLSYISHDHTATSSMMVALLVSMQRSESQFWFQNNVAKVLAWLALGIYTDTGELRNASTYDRAAYRFSRRFGDEQVFADFESSPFQSAVESVLQGAAADVEQHGEQHGEVLVSFVGDISAQARDALGAAADRLLPNRRAVLLGARLGSSLVISARVSSEASATLARASTLPARSMNIHTLMGGMPDKTWSAHTSGLVAGGRVETSDPWSAFRAVKSHALSIASAR